MKTIEDIIRELNLKITALNMKSLRIEQENNEIKCSSYLPDFNKGKIEGMREAKKLLEEVKQLDEPQRETIPKCAHEFILEGTGLGLSYFEIITSAESFANAKPQDEFSKWLRKNSGLFIRSLLDGYKVEKEPLYTVELPSMTPSKLVFDEDYCKYKIVGDYTVGRLRHHLTEKEIKYFDERYWAFAVPVEEVAE